MTLTDLGNAIRANPCAWRDIPALQQELAKVALIPTNGFDEAQRYLLARWWLQCTPANVAAINALLQADTQVRGIANGALLYVCGDLLTDALTPGNTYHPALPILETLTCRYIDPPPQGTP
jgi:hypothetical protein